MDTGVVDTMQYAIETFLSIFTTLFQEVFDLVTGNWFFLLIIGIPLISGIVFSVISSLRKG